MKKHISIMAVVATLFISIGQIGHAQSSVPALATPDILGVWRLVAADGIFGDQVVNELPNTEIVIDMQEGAVFSGNMVYEIEESEPAFHDGTALARMASEPFLGVIGWDGRTLNIAERADTSMMTGTLLNTETLSLIYIEAGEYAFAARLLLVRQ